MKPNTIDVHYMRKETVIILFAILTLLIIFNLSSSELAVYRSVYSCSIFNDNTVNMVGKDSIPEKYNEANLIFHGLNENKIASFTGSTLNDINIYVSKTSSFGIGRYIPIFKYFRITSSVSYQWKRLVTINGSEKSSGSGSFEMDGNFRIFGICSAKKSRKMAEDLINDQIQKKIKEDFNVK